ncbi:ribosomal-protein-alanine N-acetyltransferase [Novosphingobium chloroacetimidivorans]|uniref:Ribosomal-protein-alanine N-acetyltransferase n=1 Tax=Novosphingobium chloroacetimidivorans TaxID=1428314 RepID=A0A7W7NXY5_9SPHN|nr:GNAT family N-acetyltransferase [Novosphingobium chloroacetimidivorans]MBB4859597.1 ribosomal-protein-alanine N-acetyltransferase [Novosphingobium chloroacetimidivorans]
MTPRDDVDQIMTIMAAAFDPAYGEAWTRRQVEDALLMGNCHAYLAAPDGAPVSEHERAVGFSLSRTGFEEEELLLFGVIPEYRNCGVGKAILSALRAAAHSRGARRLLLEMRRGNPAERLYRTIGFSVIGERRDYYRTPVGTRIDAITFACEIT